MDQPPQIPPRFSAYPRESLTYGTYDKLKSVSDGYFGLNMVFLVNVVLAVSGNVVARAGGGAALIGFILVVGIVVGVMSYPQNKKIGYGCDWNPGSALIASILMGLNSALCCGILGFIIMQNFAATEMKKYGIKGGVFGIKKAAVAAALMEMQSAGAAPYMPPVSVEPVAPAPTPEAVVEPEPAAQPTPMIEPVPAVTEPITEPIPTEIIEPSPAPPAESMIEPTVAPGTVPEPFSDVPDTEPKPDEPQNG